MPSGGKELHCTLWRRLFGTGLVGLKSISPGKGIYYSPLRCCMLPSKENFPRQPPAQLSVVFATDFSLAHTVPHFTLNIILSKFYHTSIMKASIKNLVELPSSSTACACI